MYVCVCGSVWYSILIYTSYYLAKYVMIDKVRLVQDLEIVYSYATFLFQIIFYFFNFFLISLFTSLQNREKRKEKRNNNNIFFYNADHSL